MEEVSSLATELKAHLPWHQARIICFAQFILSLLKARSSNLTKVAEEFQSAAEPQSSYRRLKRFLTLHTFCYQSIAKLLLHWLPMQTYTLCLDRTNWQHGQKDINFLVLSIAWEGCSIPIFWELLPKKGNSNSQERIDLMIRCLEVIPADKIECLLADREFIGVEWFQWLMANNIRFRLRIKGNTPVIGNGGKQIKAWQLFSHVRIGCQETWMSRRTVAGLSLHIGAHRSLKGLLIVVSPNKPDNMVKDYYRRWSIEVLFANLKSHGFDLESTHITDPEKLKKLMAVMAIAVLWCLRIGYWKHGPYNQLPLLSHWRPEKCLFRYGLDLLRRSLKNDFARQERLFFELLQVLSPT